jgi:hypothetical protein
MFHIDYDKQTLIFNKVEQRDLAWFKDNEHTQLDIDYAFHACCFMNCDFAFTCQIIDLGVKDFEYGCVDGAILQRHYGLTYQILEKYGKSHQINLFKTPQFDIQKYMVFWASHEPEFPLYDLAIDLLPNHTKIVKKQDKYYDAHDAKHYGEIYNHLLGCMLYQSGSIPLRSFEKLSQKKFPIYQFNAQKIIGTDIEPFFIHRLKHQDKTKPRGMAHHIILNYSGDCIEQDIKKVELYLDIAEHFDAPDCVNNWIYEKMGTQFKPRIPLDEEYDFLKRIANYQAKSSQGILLQFFRHFYDYDKAVLYEKLEHDLSINEQNHYHHDDMVKL